MGDSGFRIGKRIAPPRFLMFLALCVAGSGVAIPALGWGRGTMAAFDVAAVAFLLAILPLLRRGEAEQMRRDARANDANRSLLLVTTSVVTLTVLAAVGSAIGDAKDPLAIVLVIATLILSWTFSNLIYALHYASVFYGEGEEGDAGGLEFRHCDEPDYWDFLYFSNTLGMAFATSDTLITSRRIRRIALGQTYAAFLFNLGVIAFAVGALGG